LGAAHGFKVFVFQWAVKYLAAAQSFQAACSRQVAAKTALAQIISLQSCIYMLQPEFCLLSSNVM